MPTPPPDVPLTHRQKCEAAAIEIAEATGWDRIPGREELLIDMILSHLPDAPPKPTGQTVPYVVKPLAWERLRPDEPGEWWLVSTVLGTMQIDLDEDGSCRWRYCFDEYYDEDSHACDSVDRGKTAAEAFYLQRLLPALEQVTA